MSTQQRLYDVDMSIVIFVCVRVFVDMTGSRLITCEADKTIKFWKEDETATEQSHPIDKAWRKQTRHKANIYFKILDDVYSVGRCH